MTENMTICVECKHYVKEGFNPSVCGIGDILMHDICKAREEFIKSPIFGHDVLAKPRPYCRDINKGDCKDFEKLELGVVDVNVLAESWERLPVTRWERLKSWLGMKI